MTTTRIPLSECKHGYLYKIFSRNLRLGVFDSGDNGFIGIREKFGREYLFTEYHWDIGPPFGTVSPKEELEKCPDNIKILEDCELPDEYGDMVWYYNISLFNYLKEKEKQYYEN